MPGYWRGFTTMRLCSEEMRRQLLAGEEPEWLKRHSRRKYLWNLFLSTPPWVDRKALHALSREAKRRSKRDNVPWVVDHIVPLTHPQVCGLTVPWNMRIIKHQENARRSNRWWEWTEDLFSAPEQLKIWD